MEKNYEEVISQLVEKIDIVELIGEFVDLTKSGSGYKGYSPFKSENTPSFSVHPGKKIFKDFSTGVGGNVIKFYSLIKNISYIDALIELAQRYNVTISKNFKNIKSVKYAKEYQILNDTMRYFQSNINDEAMKYLEKRGYDEKSVNKYYIGYANNDQDGLYNYLKEKYDTEDLINLGLVSRDNISNKIYDVFRERIIFPIFNKSMQVIGFGGRYIGSGNYPKYINSSESVVYNKSSEIYGIFDRGMSIKNKGYIILTEGYLDVLKSHVNGFDNTVASLGTSLTDDQVKLLKNLSDKIVIVYDNDEAGINATKRAINILNRNGMSVKCASLPEGIKDPDEYFKKYSSKDFIELIKNSIDGFEYVYSKVTKNYNINTLSSKKDILAKMREYFENITSNIQYKMEIENLASKLGIEKSDIPYTKKTKNDIEKKKTIVLSTISEEDKRKELENITIKYVLFEENVDKDLLKILREVKFKNKDYLEIHKKFESINYNIERMSDIVLNENEEKIYSLAMEYNIKNSGDENVVRLIKSWFNIDVKEMMSKKKTLELKKLSLNVERINNKLDVLNCYNEIIKLRKENSYGN